MRTTEATTLFDYPCWARDRVLRSAAAGHSPGDIGFLEFADPRRS